jgi:hypothetical protein
MMISRPATPTAMEVATVLFNRKIGLLALWAATMHALDQINARFNDIFLTRRVEVCTQICRYVPLMVFLYEFQKSFTISNALVNYFIIQHILKDQPLSAKFNSLQERVEFVNGLVA